MAAPALRSNSSLLILDSIGYVAQPDFEITGKVIVSGSHGGTAAAGYILDHPQKPRLVFFNDAGGGKEDAGIAGLELLQNVGVAACTYSHLSARIGQAQDGLAHGVISHCNALAKGLGLAPGAQVRAAVQPFMSADDASDRASEVTFDLKTDLASEISGNEILARAVPSQALEPNPMGAALRRFKEPGYHAKADNLAELRAQIDELDECIIALMAERAMLVKDAARFKADHFQVSAPQRQAEVFAKARQCAISHNLGFQGFEDVVEQTYRTMVAQFVAKESLYFDQLIAIPPQS
jgi:isochorismate pyruvate lyase